MSREIKFRAWDDTLHKMLPSRDIKELAMSSGAGVNWYQLKLMQFTGLKGKNGVEIYEGDVVYVAGLGNLTVQMDNCGYWAFMPNCYDYQDVMGYLEGVIGNIYQNPELLES